MKTPHRITLLRGENIMGRYNPVTDSYETSIVNRQTVACLVNTMSEEKVFEAYGDRTAKVISCRFQQVQEPFAKAEYQDETYEPIEVITTPIKGAIRLKKVGG